SEERCSLTVSRSCSQSRLVQDKRSFENRESRNLQKILSLSGLASWKRFSGLSQGCDRFQSGLSLRCCYMQTNSRNLLILVATTLAVETSSFASAAPVEVAPVPPYAKLLELAKNHRNQRRWTAERKLF